MQWQLWCWINTVDLGGSTPFRDSTNVPYQTYQFVLVVQLLVYTRTRMHAYSTVVELQ